MDAAELTLNLRADQTVEGQWNNNDKKRAPLKLDRLRQATIEVFADWISEGKATERREFQILGTHLYRALFNDDVETLLERARADVPRGSKLRIQLSFESGADHLAYLPWEYLFHPTGNWFFATATDLVLSRYVPGAADHADTPQTEEDPRIHVLIIVSKPKDLGPVLERPVIEAINRLAERFPIDVEVLDAPTIESFQRELQEVKPHILHFIGHGRFNRQSKESEIAFLDPDTDGQSWWCPDWLLAEHFERVSPVSRLVFLHLCEGAVVGPNQSLADLTANFAGLAPQLMQRTAIQAVVAMQHPITNRAAITFARAFYKKLLQGSAIDDAVQEGRWQLSTFLSDARHSTEPERRQARVFGTPVLYIHNREGIVPAVGEGVLASTSATGARVGAQSSITTRSQAGQTQPSFPESPAEGASGVRSTSLEHGTSVNQILSPGMVEETFRPPPEPLVHVFGVARDQIFELDLSAEQQRSMWAKLRSVRQRLKGTTGSELAEALWDMMGSEEDEDLKQVLWAMNEALEG